jgi:Zn-dependent metalloprotease
MTTRFGLLLLALGIPACANEGTDPARLFGNGSDEELDVAEDLAYQQLEQADSPALRAAVEDLRTLKVNVDIVDMAHTRVQQLAGGVPVWGGEAIVHLTSEGALAGFTDDFVPHVVVDSTPEYDADEAIDLAVSEYPGGWDNLSGAPLADLWVLRHDGVDHLVWRVQLEQINYDDGDTVPVLFVDAHDGELVWSYNNFQTATCSAPTNFYGTVSLNCYTDGTSYYLENPSSLMATQSWKNTTRTKSSITSTSTTMLSSSAIYLNANEAQYAADKVHAYYNTAFGRNGINGAGGPSALTSHSTNYILSTTSYSSGYVNAFWSSTGLYMTYGDGDGVNSGSLTTLDIAGHEMTHGVTQYEANLTYSGESGGLNEAVSDIFGAMVERSVLGESADIWKVGETTWTPATSGDALRYMNDPASDGVSYDYYSASMGSADVHYTSGLPNLAFYLLSEGGTHPRGKSATVVTAIGADAAAAIWYLALTDYMTSSTNFSGARTATLSAAGALYGTTSAEYTAVGNSWSAVGVAAASTTCSSTTYTGSLARAGKSAYHPSSSGTSVTIANQTVSLSGPTTANYDVKLEKKSGSTWSSVASSTGTTSTESIAYAGTSGTYRTLVKSVSGSGSYTLTWCK